MSAGTILGLIVSVAALIATVVVGLLRFRHERKLADIADARSILADGALELGRTKGVLRDALTAFKGPLEGQGDWPNDFASEIGKLEAAADALEAALVGVLIRFAEGSRVAKEMAAAHKDVRQLIVKYVQAYQRDQSGRARKEPEEDFSPVWETSLDFDARRAGYLEAAQRAVGVELQEE